MVTPVGRDGWRDAGIPALPMAAAIASRSAPSALPSVPAVANTLPGTSR